MCKYLYLILFLVTSHLHAQDFVTLEELGILDSLLHETSGLTLHFNTNNGDREIWTHNDADNTDSVYSFMANDLKNMTRIIDLGSAVQDWEDMTRDEDGFLYIGDFGSRAGAERQVLKMPDPNQIFSNSTTVDSIRFVFPETGYSDMEGMFALGDSLYLFTKSVDITKNPSLIEGMTYVFRIPKVPAPGGIQYMAEHAGQFMTKVGNETDNGYWRVTAADISPDKKVIALLCYKRLWILSGFSGTDFFSGNNQYVEYVQNQKEGIQFINNHELYISKEGKITTPPGGSVPKLFYFNANSWVDDGYNDCNKIINSDFTQEKYGWHLGVNGGAAATWSINNQIAEIDISSIGTHRWHISFRQKGLVLQDTKTYTCSFKAWTDQGSRTISIIPGDDSGGQYHYKAVTITPTPQEFSFEFTMDTTDYFSRLTFGLGKELPHKIYIDDVKLTENECACPVIKSINLPLSNIDRIYQTSNLITGTSKLEGNSLDVTFDSGNQIDLDSGFEVALGSLFSAIIGGCL